MTERKQGAFKHLQLPVLSPPVRSSNYADLRKCPRLYLWRHRFGLAPRRYSSALSMGTIYHEVTAWLWSGRSRQDVLTLADARLTKYIAGLDAAVLPNGMLPWGQPLESLVRKVSQDHQKAVALALWVDSVDPLDRTVWEPLAIEELLDVKLTLPSRKVPARARIDGLLRNVKTRELWIVDHKTCSQSPLQRAETLSYEFQPRLYRAIVKKRLSVEGSVSLPIVGFIHRIVRKPTIRQTKADGDFAGYLTRLTKRYQEEWQASKLPGSDVAVPYVHSELRFTEPAYTREFTGQLMELDDAASKPLTLRRYPRNSEACFTYNTPCAFLPLCRSAPALWPSLIEDHYEVRPRDEDLDGTEEGANDDA